MNPYHVQKIHEKEFLKKKNVVSIGVGNKYKNGKNTGRQCIVIGVRKKENLSFLNKSDIIPSTVNNVETDVFEIGEIKAQIDEDIDPTKKIRPLRPGCSIGHKNITAGTFGCVVYKDGSSYLLSNNHVLANENSAEIGDPILQPGVYDGGTVEVGKLNNYVILHFEGEEPIPEPPESPPVAPPSPDQGSDCRVARFFAKILNMASQGLKRGTVLVPVSIKTQAQENEVDAAIAQPFVNVGVTENILGIGQVNGIEEAWVGLDVQKYGRTTRYTQGKVLQTNATVNVTYGHGRVATFVNQIITTAMSQSGDSGSLVLSMSNKAVGLLFAGSNIVTICNPIQTVLNKLGVSL